MEIKIERKWKKDTYTIGNIYVNDVFLCNTLEDRDRGLKQTDSIETIKNKKIYGETAIPVGRYEISMDIVSQKYAAIEWYKNLCSGKLPRLLNVIGFEGVLIHPGNTSIDTLGCILVGKNSIKGKLTDSKYWFKELYKKLSKAHQCGEKICITIV